MTTEERNELVLKNVKLVTYIIKKYIYIGFDEFDDLFQEGCVGLVQAANNYKPELGYAFSSYAGQMILGTIQRYKRHKTAIHHGIVMSRSWIDENAAINKEAHTANVDFSDYDKYAEIVEKMGYKHHILLSFKSCEEPVPGKDGGETSFGALLADKSNSYNDVEFNIWVNNTLEYLEKKLSSDNYMIVEQMFYDYLKYGDVKTQKQYAEQFNLSQAQVSRIKKSVLEKIKEKNALGMER